MSRSHVVKEARKRFFDGISVPEKSEFVVDDFQKEAITSVIEGHDTLVVAPTGAGKTYIAMEAIDATLRLGRRAVYTTPLKALTNSKYNELKTKFEPEFSAGILTGDRKIEGDAHVVVATTEIYRNELYEARGTERYSLVILDEVHFIADPQRGPVWEESIILTPKSSTLLMLSASISNAQEIADWLHEVRGKECKLVTKKERPVQLRFGFLHPELGVIPIEDEHGRISRDVLTYYGSAGLDPSGRKLSVKGFRGPRRKGRR